MPEPASAAANAATEAATEPEPEHTYADVLPDSKFFEVIESAAAKGLLEGFTKDDHFRPDDKLTNADMALLFYNMAGRPKLDEEVAELQIANLKEVNEEQAMAIRWFYQAFASYGFSKDGEELKFLAPGEPTRAVDFANTMLLTMEQFDGESPLAERYSEYRDPAEVPVNPKEQMPRHAAVEMLDELTETFPVGTEMVKDLSDEILAQINPPKEEEKPVEVAVNPAPAPAPAPTPAPEPTPAPAPQPEPTPAPAPQPEPAPAPAPAPAGDMNNVQWVRDQIAGHAEACGFSCSRPAGNQIFLSAYDLNRKWHMMDVTYMGNGVWNIGAVTDFFGDYASANVSSVGEITSFISSHAH